MQRGSTQLQVQRERAEIELADFGRKRTYVDEAVVEEEPEDGRAHPRLPLHGGHHPRPHDGLQVRAAAVVERRRELRHGAGGQRARHGHGRNHHPHQRHHRHG
jgi:hypothetical protein